MPPTNRRALLAVCTVLSSLAGQSLPPPARLLKNIAPPIDLGSDPEHFTAFGPWCYFVATTGTTGAELHRTLGRPGTTELVLDLRPGPVGSQPHQLNVLGDRLCFFADDGVHGVQLYSSDGTVAGTERIDLIVPPGATRRTTASVVVGERMVFAYGERGSIPELFLSDGTAGGTVRMSNSVPGLRGVPLQLIPDAVPATGGAIALFTASSSPRGIWATDGTLAGTRQLPGWSPLVRATAIGPNIVIGLTGTPGDLIAYELNTGVSTTLASGTRAPGGLVHFAGRAVCAVLDRPGIVAVATDGVQVTPIRLPSTTRGSRQILGEAGGSLWMVTLDGILARLDPGATSAVAAGSVPSSERPAVRIRDRFYYDANPGLVEVDSLTGRSRILVADRVPHYAAYAGSLVFHGDFGDQGAEPLRYDPIRDRITPIDNVNREAVDVGSRPANFTRFGDRVIFDAISLDVGREAWISDGTEAGTILLGDLDPGGFGGIHDRYLVVGEHCWIVPLWGEDVVVHRTDGTPAGTVPLARLSASPGRWPQAVVAAEALRDGMVFRGTIGTDEGLWFLDAAGQLHSLAPMRLFLTTILVRGEIAFVAGQSPSGGLEVWLTDGTAEGTRRIATKPARGYVPTPMALFDGRLWFAHGDSVFVTDPAFRGATRATTLFAGRLVVAGDELFALGNDTISRTTGAGAGFTSIAAPRLMDPNVATAFGSGVLLLVDQRPWITDGTTAGTIQLADATVINRRAAFQITADGRAFFAGVTTGSGRSALFVTDGTPSGTLDYDDLLAGSLGVTPQETHVAAIAAGHLYIQVDSPTFGREPFVVDLGALAETVGTSCSADPGRRIEWTADAAPTLGGRIRLDGHADGATAATLLFGQPALVPFALPAPPGCALHFEPTTASAIGPFPLTGGAFSLALSIPNASVLRGAAFTLQALFAPGSRPGSVDIGPGLRLQLGN